METNKGYTFILLSGGIGSRMQQSIPKQYMLLAGKPMIMHVLDKVDTIGEITKIVIVCAKEYRPSLDLMLEQYGITKKTEYADAGKSRQASVLSGLEKADTENVIIHEAARPFVTVEDYMELINDPAENAMIGLDIPFTVLKGKEYVEGLLTRSELVNVQLPQKFNTRTILEAHRQAAATMRFPLKLFHLPACPFCPPLRVRFRTASQQLTSGRGGPVLQCVSFAGHSPDAVAAGPAASLFI